MATYSSILALEIPRTKEPGRLQPIGLQRVGHDLVTKQQQAAFLDILFLITPLPHLCLIPRIYSVSVYIPHEYLHFIQEVSNIFVP